MENAEYFEKYFKDIKTNYKIGTEYTPRTPLENLLNAIKPMKSFDIIHEAKKQKGDEGKPDFQIFKNGLLIGYLETKPVNTDLEKIIDESSSSRETKQLYRYLKVSPTLILSNYADFILFQNGVKVKTISLFNIKDKTVDADSIVKVSELFKLFFLSKPQEVTSPEKLSGLLAERTKIFKDFVSEIIEGDSSSPFKERLVGADGLYSLLKETLIDDLTLEEFADAYAQTITYGLLLSRLNSTTQIDEKTALNFIPKSIGALRELFKTIEIEEIPKNIGWIIGAIIVILNSVDRHRFDEILSFKKTYDYEDPYVYFYEKFLAEYDKAKRKAKGVYYTPIPVVWFIVKSINKLLKENFKANGLKDSGVTVLDFATGTGTFLLEAFKNAIDETDKGSRPRLIKEHLLRNFYGFEYLIAPYAIAHLKLSQFMQDNDYKLGENERINVYLTDTLDNDVHKRYSLFPKISEEGTEAYEVKQKKPILVITGNPPYSNYSRNNKEWIKGLINAYKEGLKEKKLNLDDDYIKFLRYAQWKIEQTGKGIVGVITNNSYLEGLTHREMRHKLFQTFDKIYILNLHGNSNKGETDKNVFDIKVGVTIVLFIKLDKPIKNKEIYYYSITEDGKATTREEKYKFLLDNDYSKLKYRRLNPKEPYYWFLDKEEKYTEHYNKGISLTKIFDVWGSGVKTDRDELFINFNKQKLIERMRMLFSNSYDKNFEQKYRVFDSSSYNLLEKIKNNKFETDKICKIQYRPFDYRWIYYKVGLTSRPAYEVMQHFMNGENLGFVYSRQIVSKEWKHIFITDMMAEIGLISSKTSEGTYCLPLYLSDKKEKNKQNKLDNGDTDFINPYKDLKLQPNFTRDFIKFIINKYSDVPKPDEIFSYIYAVLHSPTYRSRFYEFLKIDYPKIPFVDDKNKFRKLSKLGQQLIDIHLLKIRKMDSNIAEFKPKGNDYIEKPSYDPKIHHLYINQKQYFDNIPEDLWNFEIGGYKVLHKWLNDRKGTTLSYESQSQFKKIVLSLKETIEIMKDIDKIYNS